jgi:hypothetical protein
MANKLTKAWFLPVFCARCAAVMFSRFLLVLNRLVFLKKDSGLFCPPSVSEYRDAIDMLV